MSHKVAICGLGIVFGPLLLWPLVAAAQSGTSRQQLIASGNDSILWIIVGEWSGGEKDQTFINWLSYLDKSSAQIHPLIGIHPPKGRVIRSVVVDDDLHVFYSENGNHFRYSRRGARRELRLPGQVVPEAVAGNTNDKQPRLWAVVKDDTAQRVAIDWASSPLRTTQPSSDAESPVPQTQSSLVSNDPNSLHLVQYNGAVWEPGFAATPAATGSEHIWLCVAGERFHLFWQKFKQDVNVNYAWYEKGQWTSGPTIQLAHALQEATVNVINRQLVFTTLLSTPDDPQRLRCESWLHQTLTNDKSESPFWNALPIAKTKEGSPLLMPVGSAAVAFADNNLVALRMGDREPEIGFWSLTSGKLEQAFRSVPIRKTGLESETPRSLRELATMMVVATILFLVFWRRQGNLSAVLPLPGEFMIARPGKRALAAFIDMLPAMLVVTWWWWAPLSEFAEEARRASEQSEAIDSLPPELFWWWVWFRIIYTVYCLGFELFTSRTPGKWLMGSAVWSESLTRPTSIQIIIRNSMRLVELEPLLLVWPFMLVIFLTRNRQRVGDLLARTIVVEQNTNIIDLSERKPGD